MSDDRTPVRTPATTNKPAKPWPEFPLYWHVRGYWMCKRRGRELRYTADAMESYDQYKADLEAERTGMGRVVAARKRYTLRDAVNLYLTRQKKRLDDGELSAVQFAKCRMELDRKLKESTSFATDLEEFCAGYPGDPAPGKHFTAIRARAVGRGLQAAHRHIVIVRAALDVAARKHLMRSPDYGDDFDPPTAARIDRDRNDRDLKHGARSWSVDDLRTMLTAAKGKKRNPHLYAQMLLALFAGFGSDDCSAVPRQAFKREQGVVVFPRVKNNRPRVAALPAVVWAALDASAAHRDKLFKLKGITPAEPHLFFLSEQGKRCNAARTTSDERGLLTTGRNDTIGKNFQRFVAGLELERYRAGFKTLRAMGRTLMVGANVDSDLIAVVMGRRFRYPVDEYYIRGDLREKLGEVASHVERQLFGDVKRTQSRRAGSRDEARAEPAARRPSRRASRG
ncbi:MAG TPA: hypothetical protein VGN72_06690 [Tepidisphaeraceae bacterium]|jgi:hypothetical protein|nr:hypothetical protein [Tepidisphaeraceae bacterium]